MNRIYEWKVTNATTGPLSFDDQTLQAAGAVSVYRLTNDILAGWRQGKLVISPDPGEAIPGLKSLVALDPCQFPLPVRVIGGNQEVEGHVLAEGGPVNIAPGTRVMVSNADRRRRVFRVRNQGTEIVWLGGKNVTDETSLIPVGPGEIYTEKDVPAAAWWAYVAANVANQNGILRVQHVYAGVV